MRRGHLLTSILLMSLASCVACSALPTDSVPHEFAIETPSRDPVGQHGTGPERGSEPSELVEDFLRACAAGIFDDYTAAKLYLLPETADLWKPSEQVIVFPTDEAPSTQISTEGDVESVVTVHISTLGTVDAGGVLRELVKEGETTTSFELQKDDGGEWRISKLDDGVILSQNSFATSYGKYDVYFVSATRDALVPDPRWLPRKRSSSHLVNTILSGPNEHIRAAVVADIGEMLTVPTAGVDVRENVAHVDLEGGDRVDSESRTLLMWQISETLSQVPGVQATVVTVDSVEVDPKTKPDGPDYALDRMVAMKDGSLILDSMKVLSTLVHANDLPSDARFPSIGPLQDTPVAWLSSQPDTVYVRRFLGETVEIPVVAPSRLSVDRFGNVWVVGEQGGALYSIGSDNVLTRFDNPLADAPLVSVRVSPDGARMALLGQGSSGGALWMATLVPTLNQGLSVEMVQTVDEVEGDVLDVTWSGATDMFALVRAGANGSAVLNVPVGGWSVRFVGPPQVVWISSGKPGGVIVQKQDQSAFQRSGAAWRGLGDERKYLSSPG